jgi:hypothetical protein
MSDQIIVLSDRIKELSHSTGTGAFRLEGAATGFSAFGDFYASGDALYYAVTDGTDYEVGSGQYLPDGSSNSLVRFPFRSTNSDGLVSFAAGVKEVYVTYPGKYSVFTASGLGPFKEPKPSGLAFWGSSQILCHDDELVWSPSGNKLGISQPNPQYALDIGGMVSHSQIQASGFLDGGSGVLFSGGQTTIGGTVASGGRQLEPFIRNELDATTGSNAIFFLSGVVDQRVALLRQEKGTIFAGPPSGCSDDAGPCSPDYPTFRYLAIDDIPSLSSLYVTQETDIAASLIPAGSVAFYKESGVINYDPVLVFSKTDNRLGINVAAPRTTLDVNGTASVSGDMLVSGDAIITRDLVVGRNATISGSLDVRGDLTYIDSSTVTIWDKQLELASMSGTALYNDANVNDAGIVVKSTDTDKEWIWKDATDAWTTDQKIDVSGLVFPGNLFQIGDNAATSGDIHTKYLLSVSGVSGVHTEFITDVASNSGLLLINTSGLSGYFDGRLATNVTNIASNLVEIRTNSASGNYNLTEIRANSASGVVISGIAAAGGGSTSADILANSASGAVISGIANTNSIAINNSGTFWLGEIRTNSASGDYNLTEIRANSASGVVISGIATYTAGNGLLLTGSVFTLDDPANGTSIDEGTIATDDRMPIWDETASSWKYVTIDNLQDEIDTGGASSFADWRLTDGTVADDTINSAETVTISGISGVITQYIASSNTLRISPHGLSGVLQPQVTSNLTAINASGDFLLNEARANSASGNANLTEIRANSASGVVISGIAAGGGGFNLTDGTVAADAIVSSDTVTISGVSGILTHYNSTTNTLVLNPSGLSGVLTHRDTAISGYIDAKVGAMAGGYNHWKIAAAVGAEWQNNVNSSDVIIFKGVSGIGTYFDTATKTLSINPSGLSGVLLNNIASNLVEVRANSASGVVISGIAAAGGGSTSADILANSASGVVISGIAAAAGIGGYSSWSLTDGWSAAEAISSAETVTISGLSGVDTQQDGNFLRLSAGGLGSGLIRVGHVGGSGSNIYMDVHGSGQLTHLIFNNDQIRIGTNAGDSFDLGDSGSFWTAIGRRAGYGASGNDCTIMIGEEAGSLSSGCDYANIVGSGAGWHATACGHTNMIGYKAGYNALESHHSDMIGWWAGSDASGLDYSTAVGYAAGSKASGNYHVILGYNAGREAIGEGTIMLGYEAGREMVHVNSGVLISNRAGYGASGCSKLTAIGYEAAFGAKNCGHIEALGRSAASGMLHSTHMQIMGHQAGMAASGNESTTLIGQNAGFESAHLATGVYLGESAGSIGSGQTYSVGIGLNALSHGSGIASVAALGHSAGTYAHDIQSSEMLGHQAGQSSSGIDYSTMIGYKAGFEATGCNYSIMVGWKAGYSASGTNNSIYLGYSAGSDRAGEDGLIINPSNSATLGGWAPFDLDGMIDIADVIHGKHTSSTNKTLSVGKTPSSDTDLSNITLSVRPTSAAHTVLKTHMESAQAGDQIQSSTNYSSFSNTIVNQHGWLQVPTVLNSNHTGAARELYTHASSFGGKYRINKEDGAIAADSDYLYIAQGGYWYTAELTQT